jgi:predicted ATPase/DNA-binding SARP family transcriptional activator
MSESTTSSLYPLELRLFGDFEARVHGVPIPPPRSRRAAWLLALLALRQGREAQRTTLAGLLYPDSDEETGLANLRRLLTDLRRSLGAEGERIHAPTPRTLALDLTGAWADVVRFDAHLASKEPVGLEEAVALYRGPLLPDCTEAWITPERITREEAMLDALETLAENSLNGDHPHEAARYLRRVLALNPWRETAQRGLMRALTAVGDHAGLILSYRDFRNALRREMNAAPDTETSALFQRLRTERRRILPESAPPASKPATPAVSVPPPPPVVPASPPADAAPPRLSALPVRPLTPLIGRTQETAEVRDALRIGPLVTLTGAAGVGKTRLAMHILEETASDYPDGICWVELGPISDPLLVPQVVVEALGIREISLRPPLDVLSEQLRTRHLLLTIDNCEHMQEACAAMLTRLLPDCPSLRVLATSRHALGVAGEAVWRVPALSLPSSASALPASPPVEELRQYAAVELFVERATAAHSRFTLTSASAAAVVQVCRRLDGIPLAIELAAARVRVLSVEQIAARLDDRFRLLSAGTSSPLAHQQTLLATMEWSYNLLTEAERTLLRRLAVFAGGCTLAAAHAVGAESEEDEWTILDLLTGLADKSLIQVDDRRTGEARYYLLETVRQYGLDRLRESGDLAVILARHAVYFAEMTRTTDRDINGSEQRYHISRFEADQENIRAALREADSVTRLNIAAGFWRFWQMKSNFTEARNWLERGLTETADVPPPRERAIALRGAGTCALSLDDLDAAERHFQECLALYDRMGEEPDTAAAVNNLGLLYTRRGELEAAQQQYLRALEMNRRFGNRNWEAVNLNNLGIGAHRMGNLEQAALWHEEALTIHDSMGNRVAMASCYNNLGAVFHRRGDLPMARTMYERALNLNQEYGNRLWEGINRSNLAQVAWESGDTATGRAQLQNSLRIHRELGVKEFVADGLELLAAMEGSSDRPDRAARLLGAGASLRRRFHLPELSGREPIASDAGASAKQSLGEEAFAMAWAMGERLSLEEAVAEALDETSAR